MFLSRFIRSVIVKYPHRVRYLSSSISSEQKILSETKAHEFSDAISEKSENENNEWLWAYLRNQKTFAELTNEQKRRVVEIGKIRFLSINFRSFTDLFQNFKLYAKVVVVYHKSFPTIDGMNSWLYRHPNVVKRSTSKSHKNIS